MVYMCWLGTPCSDSVVLASQINNTHAAQPGETLDEMHMLVILHKMLLLNRIVHALAVESIFFLSRPTSPLTVSLFFFSPFFLAPPFTALQY